MEKIIKFFENCDACCLLISVGEKTVVNVEFKPYCYDLNDDGSITINHEYTILNGNVSGDEDLIVDCGSVIYDLLKG